MFSFKKSPYAYLILAILWILIGAHVGYRYVSYSSSQAQGKWGTFVEATLHQINYLPYFANNDEDIFYQSFFFNGCLYPSFSGTNIQYREELCSVETLDYKTFTIKPKEQKYRSDGTPLTLNDIYFTYNTLLKENYWNRWFLDSYKNLTVIANEDLGLVQVVFPKASIDNMIFFTNFILPSHLLANKSLETYFTTFYQDPIGTNCARLHHAVHDEKSTIFDLSLCQDVPLKYYQIKQFNDTDTLYTYINENPEAIDMVIDKISYPWYTPNKVILNKFASLFFNTERIPPTLRKILWSSLSKEFYHSELESYLVADHFLFDAFASGTIIDKERFVPFVELGTHQINQVNEDSQKEFPALPDTLTRSVNNLEQSYTLLQKITDKKTLKLIFPKAYDKVSVTLNQWREYFPSSYTKTSKTSLYNLNPIYRNINPWSNTYTIKSYQQWIITDTYTLHIYYLDIPGNNTKEINTNTIQDDILWKSYKPLHIIYFNDAINTAVAKRLKRLFEQREINDFFVFDAFDDPDMFAWKLQWKDYDIVIRSINMWLRKDISNLFLSTLPSINPSLYENEELSHLINEYFLFSDTQKTDIKTKIDTIYEQDIPLVILGKELWTININTTKSRAFTYPFRLYVLWWRKDFIKDLPIFQHFSVDRDRLKSLENFKRFVSNK